MSVPDRELMRALSHALPESRPSQLEDIADAARSGADWFAAMLDDRAREEDDMVRRAVWRQAARLVRDAGGVR